MVAPGVKAPLVEVVRSLGPWMMAGDGEGVVLTLTSGSGSGRGSLVKWKTATESQGGTPELLLRSSKRLKEHGQHPPPAPTEGDANGAAGGAAAAGAGADAGARVAVQLVDPAVVEMVDTMYAVSVSDCKGRSAKAIAALARAK